MAKHSLSDELQCITRFMQYYLMHYEIVNCMFNLLNASNGEQIFLNSKWFLKWLPDRARDVGLVWITVLLYASCQHTEVYYY